jgi:predicted dehydrogenase
MTQEKKTRIGLIGLGSAARKIHLPAYKKIETCEVAGGVDPFANAADFAFALYQSLDELVDKGKPDIVAIVTPPDSHFGYICELLRRGVHVFCEKPFVETMEQGREVIALAKEVGRCVVINNEFRYMRVHHAAKAQIGTPGFGELLFADIRQTFHVTEETESGWRGKMNRRTCYEFGTHALDLARYFFAAEPLAITARMPKPGKPQGPDYLNLITLEFPGDRVAQITLDRLSKGPHRYLDVRLDGTAACIESELGGKLEFALGVKSGTRKPFFRFDLAPSGQATLYAGKESRKLAADPIDLFPSATAILFQRMLDAIAAGTRPPCDAEENLHTFALMLAAYESAERGGARLELSHD